MASINQPIIPYTTTGSNTPTIVGGKSGIDQTASFVTPILLSIYGFDKLSN
jgi:hypothetical protein